MKDMRQLYIPVLVFVVLILFGVAMSYGGLRSRSTLGFTCDMATNGGVATVNPDTFVKVVDANVSRSFFTICNQSKLSENKVVYINYRTVANSVDETGMVLFGEGCETMPSHSIYTGEITAISSTGEPLITYIEY